MELPSICQKHWNMLREKIDTAGLGEWVAKDGSMAAQQMADQVGRGLEVGNWDPLMSAWYMITGNAMEMAGPNLLNMDPKFDSCVICFLNSQRTEDGRCPCPDPNCKGKEPGSVPDFEGWLDNAVQGQLDYARAQGLVK